MHLFLVGEGLGADYYWGLQFGAMGRVTIRADNLSRSNLAKILVTQFNVFPLCQLGEQHGIPSPIRSNGELCRVALCVVKTG